MNSIKCAKCNLVNFKDALVCMRCGHDLLAKPPLEKQNPWKDQVTRESEPSGNSKPNTQLFVLLGLLAVLAIVAYWFLF